MIPVALFIHHVYTVRLFSRLAPALALSQCQWTGPNTHVLFQTMRQIFVPIHLFGAVMLNRAQVFILRNMPPERAHILHFETCWALSCI